MLISATLAQEVTDNLKEDMKRVLVKNILNLYVCWATIGTQHREAAVLCPSEEKSSNDLLSMCLIYFSSVQNKREINDRLRYADKWIWMENKWKTDCNEYEKKQRNHISYWTIVISDQLTAKCWDTFTQTVQRVCTGTLNLRTWIEGKEDRVGGHGRRTLLSLLLRGRCKK